MFSADISLISLPGIMVVQGGASVPEIVSYMSASAVISDYKFSKYPASCHFVIVMVRAP